MMQTKYLNELTIKTALVKGLITKKEANQMLRTYLHKSNFSNIRPRPDIPLK